MKLNGYDIGTNNNNIVRFHKGKKKGFIAYDNNGKIILSRDKSVKEGYYKLSNIEERDNVILADTQRVPYDYFPDITYNEFLDVLKSNGFKIGFIEDFHYVYDDYEGDDHLVFAYDMKTHIIVVAESFDSGMCFNLIHTYCPGMSIFNLLRSRLISHGDSQMTVLDLTRDDIYNKNLGAIHAIKNDMEGIVERDENIYKQPINLRNYSEPQFTIDTDFIDECKKKIKRADRADMIKLFSQSESMMKALNS